MLALVPNKTISLIHAVRVSVHVNPLCPNSPHPQKCGPAGQFQLNLAKEQRFQTEVPITF